MLLICITIREDKICVISINTVMSAWQRVSNLEDVSKEFKVEAKIRVVWVGGRGGVIKVSNVPLCEYICLIIKMN